MLTNNWHLGSFTFVFDKHLKISGSAPRSQQLDSSRTTSLTSTFFMEI